MEAYSIESDCPHNKKYLKRFQDLQRKLCIPSFHWWQPLLGKFALCFTLNRQNSRPLNVQNVSLDNFKVWLWVWFNDVTQESPVAVSDSVNVLCHNIWLLCETKANARPCFYVATLVSHHQKHTTKAAAQSCHEQVFLMLNVPTKLCFFLCWSLISPPFCRNFLPLSTEAAACSPTVALLLRFLTQNKNLTSCSSQASFCVPDLNSSLAKRKIHLHCCLWCFQLSRFNSVSALKI